jgi:cell division protein FtsB
MRVLIGVFALALALLQLKLWTSDGGLREVAELKARVEAQSAANAALAARNAALEAEVADLEDGLDAVEERARSELGMVKRTETFYQATPMRAASKPSE